MNNRQPLEIAEYIALIAAVIGVGLSIATQNVAYAAIALTVAIALNLLNRAGFQEQIRQRTNAAIVQLDQRLSGKIDGVRAAVDALPQGQAFDPSLLQAEIEQLRQHLSALPAKADLENLQTQVASLASHTDLQALRAQVMSLPSETDLQALRSQHDTSALDPVWVQTQIEELKSQVANAIATNQQSVSPTTETATIPSVPATTPIAVMPLDIPMVENIGQLPAVLPMNIPTPEPDSDTTLVNGHSVAAVPMDTTPATTSITPEELMARYQAGVRDFARVNLQGAKLPQTYLAQVSLQGANLSQTDLSAANLGASNLTGANLSEANLKHANLAESNLMSANLQGAQLSACDLHEANLVGANLRDADLSYADLRGTNWQGADLQGANLFRAILDKPLIPEGTIEENPLSTAGNAG